MAIVVKGGGRRSTQQRPGKEEPLVGMEEGGGEKKNCSSVGCQLVAAEELEEVPLLWSSVPQSFMTVMCAWWPYLLQGGG